ncbi:DUF2379 family protein [Myxococcus sp. AM009]|uniref:DUF2379 family protein n=1 Tax=unclassified Myxococcus TaxID=2648731 RepID=UPI0015950089|nr:MULTISPECIES: DUF2379 family protein [unclassified Myxococcus]NVJ00342.1 DUF2379 family protein [Myxococcus sp. AM009]NVJ12777.1 DUF2379 family protein [Myxococcus sp. AM010]
MDINQPAHPDINKRAWQHSLSRTMSAAVRRREVGYVDGARQLIHDALAVEVVLLYRDSLSACEESLDDEP